MNKTLWSCLFVFVFVPFLLAEEIAPLPKSLIQERQTSDCLKAYQASYQERLGLEQSFWTTECGGGKTPGEILRLAVKTGKGLSPNFKVGEKGKPLIQNSLRSLDQTKNFSAYYDGGGSAFHSLAGPVSASGLKAGRLTLALPASGVPNQKQQAQLLTDFEKHLNIVGTPQEKQVIDRTLTDISGSPTARSLMQEFLKSQGQYAVSIGFSDMSQDSSLLSINGIKVINGTHGETEVPSSKSSDIAVHLNKLYLQSNPEWSRADLAEALSHELLGHALEMINAAKTGSVETYAQTALDETEAYLVGWTVTAELPFPGTDPRVRQYAREYQSGDLQSYYDNFHLQNVEYALLLDPQDMKDPIKNLKRRNSLLEQSVGNAYLDRRYIRGEEFVIEHFENVDSVNGFSSLYLKLKKFINGEQVDPAGNFASFYSRLKGDEDNDTSLLRNEDEINGALLSTISAYQTPQGQAELAKLKQSFSNSFFSNVEGRIKNLSDNLGQKIIGKKMFDYGSAPAGEWGENELEKALAADIQKHRADCAAHFKDVIEKYPEFGACNQ